MLRMIKVSRRLHRSLLLVLLSGLVWLGSLLVASVDFLPDSQYAAKGQSFSEQSNLLINPKIVRATDELRDNLSLSTVSVTDTVHRLINQASDEAERQFKLTVGNAERPAVGLRDAIKLTLAESIRAALRE